MEINFYHLNAPLIKALSTLLQKVLDSGKRVVIFSPNSEKISQLDDELWTSAKIKFIPHGTSKDGYTERQPIYLTSISENPNNAEILILLDEAEEQFMNSFSKVIYMFEGNDSSAVEKARGLWSKYQGAGHSLSCFKKGSEDKWQKHSELV